MPGWYVAGTVCYILIYSLFHVRELIKDRPLRSKY